MSNNNKLTVEIFRDLQTPGVSVDPVITSVNGIAKLANAEFDILRADRRLKFAPGRQETIHANNIKWQNLPADINLILSSRPIRTTKPGYQTQGHSIVQPGPKIGVRGALISTYDNDQVTMVASHEIAHTLNLKNGGESWDGDGHCKNEHCLLHKQVNTTEETVVKTPSSFAGWTRRFKSGTMTETKINHINSTPCSECTMQIGFYAAMLLEVKKGRSMPSSLIFPAAPSPRLEKNGG